jgi:hypothetical protein
VASAQRLLTWLDSIEEKVQVEKLQHLLAAIATAVRQQEDGRVSQQAMLSAGRL